MRGSTTIPYSYAISIPSHRNKLGIFLMTSLPTKEIVVAAAGSVRVLVAYTRPGVVNGAATGFGVQEHADGAEEIVLLMTENLLALNRLGEPLFGGLGIDSEMARQPVQVTLIDGNPVVAAAVGGAFEAVVKSSGR